MEPQRLHKTWLLIGRMPHLLALFCPALLICGLLTTNYTSQRTLNQQNTQRFQHNLQRQAATIGYFFSERENDIADLAASKSITGFFSNRSLGMTMEYGLQASRNNVTRVLKRRMLSSRLEADSTYTHLLLLDKDGSVIARWPSFEMLEHHPVPEDGNPTEEKIIVESHRSGCISFTSPVYLHKKLQGFVRGWVDYDTLVTNLLGSSPSLMFITDRNTLVFQSQRDLSLKTDFVKRLGSMKNRGPTELNLNDLFRGEQPENREDGPVTLFSAPIPGYPIDLYLTEDGYSIGQHRELLVFMAVLASISVGIFLISVMVLRTGTKNLLLETSLAESEKREKAVAEKKEELELIIEGARLGTWDWNIVTGEVRFNTRWMTMLGYEPDELEPCVETWEKLVHPDDWEAVMEKLQAHLDGTSPVYSIEHRLRHKSGRWIWVLDAGKVLHRDREGNPTRALGIHLDITEQKESQGLLVKAKEESDTIIRNFLDTLIVVNRAGSVVRVNQATCDLLGYGADELFGKPITNLFHDPAEQVEAVFSFYAKCETEASAQEHQLRNIELCYRTKGGRRLPMSFNISLLKDEKGLISGVVAGAKDISKLKLAAEKITQQKDYIENLFNVVPEGLLALDPSMQVIKSNMAFNNIITTWSARFGRTPDELTKEFLLKLREALVDKKRLVFSLGRNNTNAVFKYNATPIPSRQGIEHVVSISDITEERKAEAAGRLLATVIEQTADSVILTDTEGTIRYVNPATEVNSGYSRDEIVGKTPALFKSGQVEPEIYAELWKVITSGLDWSGRLTNRRKDGTIIEEDVVISPVRNEEDVITHYVAIKRDVTDMEQLQRQLLQAKKLEAIGQLAAGIAHEINTPMQYVQNNVTFLERAFGECNTLLNDYRNLQADPAMPMPEAARKHLEEVDLDFLMEEVPESIEEAHEGIDRVVKIVAAMKEFSHPGTDEMVPIDLNRALESTITISRNEWKYVAEMHTDLDDTLPMVPCLPDQLNQAVLNLIVNAAHAIEDSTTDPGVPKQITVSSRNDCNWAEIRVADNGTGIPEEVREKIFDPFFTTKEVGKGTGQGLNIIHDVIVQKHKGTIDFITECGKGTTFIIRLPMEQKNGETEV